MHYGQLENRESTKRTLTILPISSESGGTPTPVSTNKVLTNERTQPAVFSTLVDIYIGIERSSQTLEY